MRHNCLNVLPLLFALCSLEAVAMSDLERNILIGATPNTARRLVELSVQNLNEFDVTCKTISLQAHYIDTDTHEDLGFRPVFLRDVEIKAGGDLATVEAGYSTIEDLEANHPHARIQSIDGSDATIRYSCAPAVAKAASIGLGDYHSCAVTDGGGVQCWGFGENGALGDADPIVHVVTKPKVIEMPKAASIATSRGNSCAVTTVGDLYCWGFSQFPQSSTAADLGRQQPVKIDLTQVSKVAVSEHLTCALRAGGELYCWGAASVPGVLGDGRIDGHTTSVPTKIALNNVLQVAVADDHVCAIVSGGDLYCWGAGAYYSWPVAAVMAVNFAVPVKVNLSRITRISAARGRSCALNDNGEAYCWGHGNSGSLGDGLTSDHHVDTPNRVAGLSGLVDIVVANDSTCAVQQNGKLYCWGDNTYGQLGAGNAGGSVGLPTESSRSDVTAVAIGQRHVCAIAKAGDLYCWGGNWGGALGLGDERDRSDPAIVKLDR